MPHFYQDILVVTADELVESGLFSNKHQVSKKCRRDEKRGFGYRRIRKGGGKNNPALIEFDSLPKQHRDVIGDPRELDNILEKFYIVDSAAHRYYINADNEGFSYADGNVLLPKTVEQLTINASVMNACIELYDARKSEWIGKGKALRSLLSSVHKDCVAFNKVLEKQRADNDNAIYTHSLPTSYRNWKRNFEEYRTADEPYRSLIKDADGKSKMNREKCDERHKALLNSMFTKSDISNGKPNLFRVHKDYEAFINGQFDIYDEEGVALDCKAYETLSLSTVKRELSKWENRVGSYAVRSGDRQKLIDDFIPSQRFVRPMYAGSQFSIDDRQPPFEYEKGKRAWFYVGMDVASGAFPVWVSGKSKEGIILEFYRETVRRYHHYGLNLPWELEAESSLNSSFRHTFLRPGAMFEEPRIIANKAREKRIEREFGFIRYGDEKDREGWIARPFSKRESNQPKTDKKTIIPFHDLIHLCEKDIETHNNLPHPEHPEMSQWDYFMNYQNPELKPTNYKSFMFHIGYKRESSCKRGQIAFDGNTWLIAENGTMLTGESLIQRMKFVEGQKIDIYWLDDIYGEPFKAMVYTSDGRYITELVKQPKPQRANVEKTDEDWKLFQQFKAYQSTIEDYMKHQKNAIRPVYTEDKRTKTVGNSFSLADLGRKEQTVEQTDEAAEVIKPNEDFEEEIINDGQDYSWRDQLSI